MDVEMQIVPSFGLSAATAFTDFGARELQCEYWFQSNKPQSIKCNSSWGGAIEGILLNTLNNVVISQVASDVNLQIDKFFWGLEKSLTIINKKEVKKFLISLNINMGEIVDPFLELNKIIATEFRGEKIKVYIEKYDDRETEDHFIFMDVRHENYPDDFMDKIRGIRDKFSEKFPDNDWLLISTHFKQPKE
ncbi:MAG: hypothetical protein ABFC71_09945 [Methanoregula sp.]